MAYTRAVVPIGSARERGPNAGEVIATWRRASDGSTFVRYFYGAGNAVRIFARSMEAERVRAER